MADKIEPMDPLRTHEAYLVDEGQDMHEYAEFLRAVGTGTVMEIGVRGGVSTAAFLLSAAERTVSVDVHDLSHLYAGHPKWHFIHADSRNAFLVRGAMANMGMEAVDVLLVDGDHSFEGLYGDLREYAPMVRRGGLVLAHDVAPVNSMDLSEKQVADGWAGPWTSRAWNRWLGETGLWERATVLPGKFGLGAVRLP